MTHDELIAALEAATGPSRELDAEIAFQTGAFDRYLMGLGDCHIVSVTPASNNCAEILIRADARTTGGVQYTSDLPAYTASIDAALTLYKLTPRYIPSNPVEVCKEALRQW